MKKWLLVGVLVAVSVAVLLAQATNIRSSGTLPTGCRVGDIYVKTGTSAGFYACITANSWTGPYATASGSIGTPGTTTDNAIVRWDGTGGSAIQNSGITVDDSNVIAFPDGVKQTFNPDGTTAGFNVGSQAGDPSSLANGDLWYDSTNNTLDARINGSTVSLGAGGTGDLLDWQFVRKTSDESVSNTTNQDDDELALSVSANQVWQFDILLFVTNAANTADIKVNFTIPAAATVSWVGTGYDPNGTTQQTNRHIARFQSTSQFGIGVLQTATEPASHVRISGLYIGGANGGTLQLQWAQAASDGSNATVVKADSYLIARRF